MKPGLRQRYQLDEYNISVFWTQHIIDRINDRERRITPELIDFVTDKGIAEVSDMVISANHPIKGVIQNASTKLNLMYYVKLSNKKITLILSSAIIKEKFISKSITDHIIKTNPARNIIFKCKVNCVQRELVIADIMKRIKKGKFAYWENFSDGIVNYVIECEGGNISVIDAGWDWRAKIIKI